MRLLAFLLLLPGLAFGQEMHTFENGEVADAQKINENFLAVQRPKKVVLVATDGSGDYGLLSEALDSIKDASEINPYLIQLAPGIYNEPGPVVLKSNVSVWGSGRENTTITCACANDDYLSSATLKISRVQNVAVRNLRINNSGGDGGKSYAVLNYLVDAHQLRMIDVSVTAEGNGVNGGIANESAWVTLQGISAEIYEGSLGVGIYTARGDANIKDSTVDVTADVALGVNYLESTGQITSVEILSFSGASGGQSRALSLNNGSSVSVRDSTIASQGVSNIVSSVFLAGLGQELVLQGSKLVSSKDAILSEGDITGSKVLAMSSIIHGDVTFPTISCQGSVDESFAALTYNCGQSDEAASMAD